MELSLPYTFLKDLSFSGTSFAVLESRVYTLHQQGLSSNGNYFQNGNEQLVLAEAEEVSELEKEIFSDKQNEIEKYMSWVIDFKLVRKIKDNNSKLQGLGNIYEALKDNSIERFIMVEVFNEYNHENTNQQKIDVDGSKWESIPEILNQPSAEDIISRENCLEGLLNDNGLLVSNTRCYILNRNGGNGDNGFVLFKGKKLFLSPFLSLDDLEDQYKSRLLQRIEKKAFEHGTEYKKILMNQKGDINKLDLAITSQENYQNTTKARRGPVGFRKLSNNEYELFLYVDPFILEKDNKYYFFPKIELSTELKVDSNQLQIVGPLKVLNTPYDHPFVYDWGEICYGKLDWFKDKGVIFGHYYDLNEMRTVARKISKVLTEGERVIEKGYFGTNVVPVNKLDSFPVIATTRSSVQAYASSHGIPKERIMDNK